MIIGMVQSQKCTVDCITFNYRCEAKFATKYIITHSVTILISRNTYLSRNLSKMLDCATSTLPFAENLNFFEVVRTL